MLVLCGHHEVLRCSKQLCFSETIITTHSNILLLPMSSYLQCYVAVILVYLMIEIVEQTWGSFRHHGVHTKFNENLSLVAEIVGVGGFWWTDEWTCCMFCGLRNEHCWYCSVLNLNYSLQKLTFVVVMLAVLFSLLLYHLCTRKFLWSEWSYCLHKMTQYVRCLEESHLI